MMRIGVMIGRGLGPFAIRVLEPILSDPSIEIGLAFIDDRPGLSIAQRISKNLRRGRGGYVGVMMVQTLIGRLKNETISARSYFAELGIPILRSESPYSEQSLARIESENLDALVLLGGFGIVKSSLLSIPKHGILSYHHGDMRKYRGMPPAFWELYNDEEEMGVTVQRLAKRLDAGIPIVEKKIAIIAGESWSGLTKRAYSLSEGMMHEALRMLDDGLDLSKAAGIEKLGKVYSLPNLGQWIRMNMRVFGRNMRRTLENRS